MNRQELLKKKYGNKKSSTKGRVDANNNPIEFRLSFDEWCQLWDEANVLPQQPYVMSRRNDIGHYEIGNVYIQRNFENSTEHITKDNLFEQRVNELAISTGYKRRIVKAMLARGELE